MLKQARPVYFFGKKEGARRYMIPKISNFNALSALLDRLSIENGKLNFFANSLEHDELSEEKAADYHHRVKVLEEIIGVLKKEITDLMEEAFIDGKYEFVSEYRTFA